MSWFEKLIPSSIQTEGGKKGNVPEGLWSKCESCEEVLFREDLERNLQVCPKCGHHMRIDIRERLTKLLDDGVEEIAANLEPVDRLKFKDSKRYIDRIKGAQKVTNEHDAFVGLSGQIKGENCVAAGFNFAFMGGSMGSVVGEKFVRCVNHAIETNAALVVFTASGGARMQEALFSLFQMAKTSAALTKLSRKKLPFIVVLTHPTMGGVSASFAMLGDIHIAEPNALIGFAGPRVIEQTVRETLPEGFQRSEFLVEHGAVDVIVDRREQRDYLADVLGMLNPNAEPNGTDIA